MLRTAILDKEAATLTQIRDVIATLNDQTEHNHRSVSDEGRDNTRDPSKDYLDDTERLEDCHDGYHKQFHNAHKKHQKAKNAKNGKNGKNGKKSKNGKNGKKGKQVKYHMGFIGPKGPKPLNNPHTSPLYDKNCVGGKCPKEKYNPLEDPQNIYFMWHHRPHTALGMAYIPHDEHKVSSVTPTPAGGFAKKGKAIAYAAPTPVGGF